LSAGGVFQLFSPLSLCCVEINPVTPRLFHFVPEYKYILRVSIILQAVFVPHTLHSAF
jgi:hypothetical protein